MIARETSIFNPLDLEPDIAVGIALPFVSKNGGVFALNYTTEAQSISNFKNLLLTRKGERLMHPTFGSSIYDSLFDQHTDDLLTRLKTGIKTDTTFWCPQIIINDIQVTDADDISTVEMMGHGIKILIQFRVDISRSNRTILLFVSSNGSAQIINDQNSIISTPEIR